MKELLSQFIFQKDFPCIMAKSLFKNGHVAIYSARDLLSPVTQNFILEEMYQFIEKFRAAPEKLSSFMIALDLKGLSFQEFEKIFWKFLSDLYLMDKANYGHDPRVSSNPDDGDFSFSIKEESFFILGLHPKSPRKSRRFSIPTIVFNPHEQFERLRREGIFKKIRTLIRNKDEKLQGERNPMLSDFGGRSEIFQYLGISYPPGSPNSLKSEVAMQIIQERSGTGFVLRKGERLKVTDIKGEQVSDFFCFFAEDKKDYLSSGRTLDYMSKLFLTTGDTLYSSKSKPMARIVEDKVIRHDFLLTPCSHDTFRIIYHDETPHRGCEGNLIEAFGKMGIPLSSLPTTFNLFMNVAISPEGELKVLPPKSRAGDYIVIEALDDLIVGLTACSALQSNNFSFKPIGFEVFTSKEKNQDAV